MTDRNSVLILVLVEHTLRELMLKPNVKKMTGLNPCFSGTYSQSQFTTASVARFSVLILVLVEHTLREHTCGI